MIFFKITAAWLVGGLLLSVVQHLGYAQENSMIMTTGKGSLDIRLEPIASDSTEVRISVSFLNPGTEKLHEHQDYDLMIPKDRQVIFSAAQQTNQPLIHNVEGRISTPYNFEAPGQYEVEVRVLRLGFGPTLVPIDENAVFPISIGGGGPTASLDVATPTLKNSQGNIVTGIAVGQQAMLSTTVANDSGIEQSFIPFMEVRGGDGVTIHLVWVTGSLPPAESIEIGSLWIPDSIGGVEVRTFAVANLTNPEVLSSVKITRITVDSPREEPN